MKKSILETSGQVSEELQPELNLSFEHSPQADWLRTADPTAALRKAEELSQEQGKFPAFRIDVIQTKDGWIYRICAQIKRTSMPQRTQRLASVLQVTSSGEGASYGIIREIPTSVIPLDDRHKKILARFEADLHLITEQASRLGKTINDQLASLNKSLEKPGFFTRQTTIDNWKHEKQIWDERRTVLEGVKVDSFVISISAQVTQAIYLDLIRTPPLPLPPSSKKKHMADALLEYAITQVSSVKEKLQTLENEITGRTPAPVEKKTSPYR